MNATPSTPEPVRLGIIGAGEIVRTLAAGIVADGQFEVRAVTDLDYSAATRTAALFPDRPTVRADLSAFLADPEIEAIYIATPTAAHRTQFLAALGAGKHVLCEKPFMLDPTETEEALAAAAARPELVAACCASRFRFTPLIAAARRHIASGRLGALREVRFLAPSGPPSPDWRPPAWRRSRALAGGGLAMDWGVYDLEFLTAILGDLFQPVALRGGWEHDNFLGPEVESGFAADLTFADGTAFRWDRLAAAQPQSPRIEIFGAEARLEMPFLPDANITLREYSVARPEDAAPRVLVPPCADWDAVLRGPLRNFAAAIRGLAPLESPLATQRIIHRVIAALYASASANGASVPISPL